MNSIVRVAALALGLSWVLAWAEEPPRPAADSLPAKAVPKARKSETMDHLELGSTTITGNRELPKVMYVVPWKRADLGDPGGKPVNSLIDEALQPLDREVFGREISYFRALTQRPDAQVETPVTAPPGAP